LIPQRIGNGLATPSLLDDMLSTTIAASYDSAMHSLLRLVWY
jgi:hypothetical protein